MNRQTRLQSFSMRIGLIIILCFYFTTAVMAFDQIDQEENNEFGGKTIVFQDPKIGIFRGKNLYDSGGAIMRQDWNYAEDFALASGVSRRVMDFLFDVKTKETVYFTKKYQALRLVSHVVSYFEQATGTLQKKENYFVVKDMGLSVEYYDVDGLITKTEWNYPNNIEGIAKKTTYYDENKRVVRVEAIYTERTQNKQGLEKTVFIEELGRKKTREWTYTDEFARTHEGAKRKLVEYFDHPSQNIAPKKNWFNAKDELVRPTVEMPTPIGE